MRTVAFYLPQYHAIPENDEWWGSGFTEWVNVRRATPQFEGHDHPRVPGQLGEYDLTDPAVAQRQTEMARQNGVDAFCMYFYWFDGHRLLDRPVENWRQRPDLLPYCLSWANENWTRRWDGKDKEVLAGQNYEPGYVQRLFGDFLPHFQAPHYLRQMGLPVLLVHRVDLIPDARAFAREMRERAVEAGLGGLHLIAAETKHGLNCLDYGFDAIAEFPPVGANTLGSAQVKPVAGLSPSFRGRLLSYEKVSRRYRRRPSPSFVRHRGVMPSWDNTARRGSRSTIYVGATPARYAEWLRDARLAERQERGSDGLVFINAWNEWAEGAYLEPDRTTGDAYLRATRDEVGFAAAGDGDAPQGRVTPAQVRSLIVISGATALKYQRAARTRARRLNRAARVWLSTAGTQRPRKAP